MNGVVDHSAIYAQCTDIETSKSPTRVRVNALPVLVERIKSMPDALRVEFRVRLTFILLF